MATKLDQAIARVAVALGTGNWSTMTVAAAEVAAGLSAKDLQKLPDKWYPAISAAKAGVPDLKDVGWDHFWFEAITEILAQKKQEGLPGLLELMDRQECTYHQFPVVRLLRLAADGCEPEMVLARVRSRLETLRLPWVRFVVQEIEAWQPVDPRPLQLLLPLANIAIPGGEGDTLATCMKSMTTDRRSLS
ncbi:MAG: hypothetical protein JSS02_30585 [Planctomycetes bacterium]|nr:hypothetical protein [Planctomycetota bacterium]